MRYARKVKFVTLSVKGVAACTRCKAMDSRVLLAFLCLVAAASAEYNLQVDVESFANPHSFDFDGGCCEGQDSPPCQLTCDYVFLFCLQPAHYEFNFCPLGSINTQFDPTISGTSFTFGSMIQPGVPNPLTFTNTAPWPGSFQLMTRVNDIDPDATDLIDRLFVVLTLPVGDQFTDAITVNGVNQPTITITFRFRVTCATNFFGPNCTRFCQGRDDASGHFTCDANGDKVCLGGYVNPASDCVTPVCTDGCDPMGGFCDAPGECLCNTGWTGGLCDICIMTADGCENGHCDVPGECICDDGFSGNLCRIDDDVCGHQMPCQNGATCANTLPDEYECTCATGYTGENCEDDIDDCASTPCLNGGSCEDLLNDFQCDCSTAAGWEGPTCEDNTDECQAPTSPCLNGGTCIDCVPTSPSVGTPGNPGTGGDDCPIGYLCNCSTGFFGDMCEGDFDFCMSAPCRNGATCHDQVTDYRCACPPGFTDTNCETEIDECDPNPCLNGGSCDDLLANYTCDCAPGFTGRDCSVNIDDCPGNACVANNTRRCEDGINSYTCACHPGFTGQFCESDIDDCDPSRCLEGSTCVDLLNDFRCECATGFTGPLCSVDIDDCVHPDLCLNNGLCIDRTNDFVCDCVLGFSGRQCETALPPACQSNPCGVNEFCVDMGPEDFSCESCRPGVGGVCASLSPSPSVRPEPQSGDENTGVIIGAVTGGVVGAILLLLLLLLCCCWFCFCTGYCMRKKVEENEATIGYDTMRAVGNQNPIYFGPNTLLSSKSGTLSSQGSSSLNRRSVQVQNPMYALSQTVNGNPALPPRNGSFQTPLVSTESTDGHHHYDTIPALSDGAAPSQATSFGHAYAQLENVNSRDPTPQGTPTMALSSGKYDHLKDSKEGLPLLSANGNDSPLTSARGSRAVENPYVESPLTTYSTVPRTDYLDLEDKKLKKVEVLGDSEPGPPSSENPYVAFPE